MIVMIEASTHTIARLWERARSLSKGDPEDREFGAGMQEVLRGLGVIEPVTRRLTNQTRTIGSAQRLKRCGRFRKSSHDPLPIPRPRLCC
jgi:hypothetical protein